MHGMSETMWPALFYPQSVDRPSRAWDTLTNGLQSDHTV